METEQKDSVPWLRKLFSKQIIIIIFLFLTQLAYALFLLQNLSFYMYGFDDFHLIYQSFNLSFMKIVTSIFLYPLQLYEGFVLTGIYQRAVHGLFIKISYILGGVDPSFYHMLRIIFFALTGILIYLFTKKMTKNETVSIAATFLYGSMPVVYDGLRHIGAAEPFSQFLLLLALYLFVGFYNNEENYIGKRKYLYPLIIFLLGLFAIKARETEIVLLPVIGGFLILKYKEIKRNMRWWLMIFVLSLYILPALFSQFHGRDDMWRSSIQITSEKIIINIKNLLFYNPATRTGNGEQTLVLFSLQQYVSETPGSLLGSLGFFIGWYFITMSGVYGYYLLKTKRKEEVNSNEISLFLHDNYFITALLWFIFSILLMILYVNPSDHSDIRYIGVMALPAILVIVPFCYFMTEYIKKLEIKYLSKYIMVLFLILLLLSIIINVGITSIYRRGGIGSRHTGMAKSTETIFEDLYHQSFDNSYFFAITEISGIGQYIPCTFSTNLSMSDITVTNDPFLSITRPITDENINKSLSEYRFVYLISYRKPLTIEWYPDMQLVKEINPCVEGYYCRLKEFLKKQDIIAARVKEQLDQEPKYFVYKIVRDNRSFEKPIKMLCSGKEGLPENSI